LQFKDFWPAVFTLIVLAAVAGIALSCLVPPPVEPVSAPPAEFSAARAFEHLKVIAREPHPTGSVAIAKVRDYLIQQLKQQGFVPQVQRTSIASLLDIFPGAYAAGTIENVLVRLKGSASTGVVLLMAHYDSVGAAPGATDDGSGVVTLLETLRALKSAPPLRNDVVFLFTDGEELGEVGSQAFVSEHPWAKEISAVWNLDSGGSCGAADVDFANGSALGQLRRVIPRPLTTSIGREIARLGPPGGDDTLVFDPARVPIAKASYGGCYYRYHTAKDDLENVDLRSVQHLGIYTLAVSREWGNSDLRENRTVPDSVFFNLLVSIISYPVAITRPICLLLLVAYSVVVLVGLKQTRLDLRGFGLGILLWAVVGCACVALVAVAWSTLKAFRLVNYSYSSAYNAEIYGEGFVVLSIAVVSRFYLMFRRKTDPANLAIGGLFWCLVIAIHSSWFAPGVSFPFVWPLGFALLSLAISFQPKTVAEVVCLLCCVPVVLLFAPLIAYLIFHLAGDPGPSLILSVVLTVISLAFLAPHLDVLRGLGGLKLCFALALIGVWLVGWGALHSRYDNNHPRPDTIAYWLNVDTRSASWISLDEKPDQWTSQFLSGSIRSDTLSIFARPGGDTVLLSNAPPLPLTVPPITLLNELSAAGVRTLCFRLTSTRNPATLWVSVQNATVLEATIDGKKAPSKMIDLQNKLWGFYYAAPDAQGIELVISVKASDRPQVTLTDQTIGLPDILGFQTKPRTLDFMPRHYFPAFDSTVLVSKTFTASIPK
jgi:hypothetical protein